MELVPIGRRHFDLKSVQMGPWRCCKETEVGLKCGQRTWFADQNQPLISLGKNSGLSQPSKLHLGRSRFNLFQRHHLLSQELAAGGPEELHAPIDETLDPVVLLLGLEGHKVHAALPWRGQILRCNLDEAIESEAELIYLRVNSLDKPAVVSRVEPIPFGIPHLQERVCKF